VAKNYRLFHTLNDAYVTEAVVDPGAMQLIVRAVDGAILWEHPHRLNAAARFMQEWAAERNRSMAGRVAAEVAKLSDPMPEDPIGPALDEELDTGADRPESAAASAGDEAMRPNEDEPHPSRASSALVKTEDDEPEDEGDNESGPKGAANDKGVTAAEAGGVRSGLQLRHRRPLHPRSASKCNFAPPRARA